MASRANFSAPDPFRDQWMFVRGIAYKHGRTVKMCGATRHAVKCIEQFVDVFRIRGLRAGIAFELLLKKYFISFIIEIFVLLQYCTFFAALTARF